VSWAEELIEPARAVDHPRLLTMYILGTLCFYSGRVEDAIRYSDAGRELFVSGGQPTSDVVGNLQVLFATWLGGIYIQIGQSEAAVEFLRHLLENHSDPYAFARAGMVYALMRSGSHAEAKVVAKDLVNAADSFANPWARSYALLTFGIVYCDADPSRAGDALRRGLTIARDSGNRYNESHIANILGRLEAQHGDLLHALEYLTLAIRNYHDSGNSSVSRVPLAVLATILDRLGRTDAAATIAGYASSPISKAWVPELGPMVAHLRSVLSDETFESLYRRGAAMTGAAVAAYAYREIAAAREQLELGA
jgi:tetratricopeptide (TPR) repeat protein